MISRPVHHSDFDDDDDDNDDGANRQSCRGMHLSSPGSATGVETSPPPRPKESRDLRGFIWVFLSCIGRRQNQCLHEIDKSFVILA